MLQAKSEGVYKSRVYNTKNIKPHPLNGRKARTQHSLLPMRLAPKRAPFRALSVQFGGHRTTAAENARCSSSSLPKRQRSRGHRASADRWPRHPPRLVEGPGGSASNRRPDPSVVWNSFVRSTRVEFEYTSTASGRSERRPAKLAWRRGQTWPTPWGGRSLREARSSMHGFTANWHPCASSHWETHKNQLGSCLLRCSWFCYPLHKTQQNNKNN